MFSGIVADQGRILKCLRTPQGLRLSVRFRRLKPRLETGESIALNGVCLTAARVLPRGFEADVVPETLKATTLGRLQKNADVNLERALRYGQRLGGHTLSGHVDGRGAVAKKMRQGSQTVLWLRVPAAVRRFCLPKGSIALDGVSLTIQGLDRGRVKVALIPHTLKVTTLGRLRAGDPVNIEADRQRLPLPAVRILRRRPQVSETARDLRRKMQGLARRGF